MTHRRNLEDSVFDASDFEDPLSSGTALRQAMNDVSHASTKATNVPDVFRKGRFLRKERATEIAISDKLMKSLWKNGTVEWS